ncbi:MAG: hypothetical protein ABIW31_01920 [Novosphingobium sp.]
MDPDGSGPVYSGSGFVDPPMQFDPAILAENAPSRFAEIASAALTIASIVAIAAAAHRLSLSVILSMLPSSPLFWLAFVVSYFTMPISDWIIFRRLWNIPAEGFIALLRKYVLNEVVLGYLGEAKFYAWARSRLSLKSSPFGAVKDVAILSAMVGNVLTLLLLLGVWPIVTSNAIGLDLRASFLSLAVVLASSFVVLLFRRKLFSLPGRDLWFISGVHVSRTVMGLGLTAVMWHLVLPQYGIGSWLILATLRMLVSRLPLVANKDLFFSVLALYALGNQPQLTSLLAMMAGLVLTAHILTGLACAGGEIYQVRNRK